MCVHFLCWPELDRGNLQLLFRFNAEGGHRSHTQSSPLRQTSQACSWVLWFLAFQGRHPRLAAILIQRWELTSDLFLLKQALDLLLHLPCPKQNRTKQRVRKAVSGVCISLLWAFVLSQDHKENPVSK